MRFSLVGSKMHAEARSRGVVSFAPTTSVMMRTHAAAVVSRQRQDASGRQGHHYGRVGGLQCACAARGGPHEPQDPRGVHFDAEVRYETSNGVTWVLHLSPQLLVYLGVPFCLLLLPSLPDRPMLLLLPLLLSIMPGSRELLLPVLREAARLVHQMVQHHDPPPPTTLAVPRAPSPVPQQQRRLTGPPRNNVSVLPLRVGHRRARQRLVRHASFDRVGIDIPLPNLHASPKTRDVVQR